MTNPKLLIALLLATSVVVLVAGLMIWAPEEDPAVSANALAAAARPASSGITDAVIEEMDSADSGVVPILPRLAGAGSARRESGSGENLLLRLASLEDSRARQAYLDQVTPALAALGPDEALARVWQLEDEELRDMAMLALLQEWSGVSTLELVRGGSIWRYGTAGALAAHLLDSGKFTPSQAADLALTGTDGRRRGDLLARIGAQMAAEDPAAAMALAAGLDARQQERYFSRLASELAATSPQMARQMAASMADPAARSAMLARILEAEAANNPVLAAQNFLNLPPETPQAQMRAAQRIASEWASRDTMAAMQWAGSLADDSARQAARRGIEAVAPIGIGARLATGEGGVPVLQELVPGGPASLSGQLRAGDAVLAVSDAAGQWVDSRGMRVGQLVGLIRGEPNTQVSLQVQSPGESAPRVVTIGRQQVIYRSP
jgi:hypothetical protein